MSGSDLRISLADLSAAGLRLRPVESVTVVRALALEVARGVLPGVPSPHVIRFDAEGCVSVEGPVAAGGRNVQRAALLLETLLPGFDAPPELRVPGALRLVVARALGTLDLPPYPSLESFAEALGRFASADPQAVVADLVKSWSASVNSQLPTASAHFVDSHLATPDAESEAAPDRLRSPWESGVGSWVLSSDRDLTISDIRRARRATRLTLSDISARTRIPVPHLRELEWGYFRHWPTDHYGRTQLVRYARASGLDDQLVVRTVWPMIQEEHARLEPATALTTPVPADVAVDLEPLPLRTGTLVQMPALPRTHAMPRRRLLAALAIPALVALGIIPAMWQRSPSEDALREVQTTNATRPRPEGSSSRSARPPAPTPAPTAATRAHANATPPRAATPLSADQAVAAIGDVRPQAAMADVNGEAFSPSFASAGSAMFYHSDGALMRADTDSGGAVLRVTRVVDAGSRNFHARPSPDGRRIAFDSDREGDRAVYIADANGKGVQRISGEGFAAIPSWSPDGRTIAFVRGEPDRPRVWNIWTADLQTGELRRVTSHGVGQPWGASWFPDGTHIAYSHETRLVVRNLATGREQVYPSPIKGRFVRAPAVSPDGRHIIFQVYRNGAWLLELSDGSMRRVLADSGAEEYTWSPDGRRVAYHSRQSGEWGVWIMATR